MLVTQRKQPGFTIVELLIVIVVIGILAAITIVAYGGIQQRARVASLQSDLRSAATTLATFGVTNNDRYPIDLASANLKASPGTSYQYSVDNSVNPATYCVTAINGSVSYYMSNVVVTAPTAGNCSSINGIVGWWPLNGDASDSSGNRVSGVVNNAVATVGANGQANNAYLLSGSASYIRLAKTTPLSLSASDLSVSAWVKLSSAPASTWNDIFSSDGSDWSVGLDDDASGNAYLRMTDTNIIDAPQSSRIITLNVWHHVVATYNTSTYVVAYYVDGQPSGGGTWTNVSTYLPFTSGTKIIGARNGGSSGFFRGALDDIRIYNRVLSVADAQGLYATGAQ